MYVLKFSYISERNYEVQFRPQTHQR